MSLVQKETVKKSIQQIMGLIGYLNRETAKDFTGYDDWQKSNFADIRPPAARHIAVLKLIDLHWLEFNNRYKYPQFSLFIGHILEKFIEEKPHSNSASLAAQLIEVLGKLFSHKALGEGNDGGAIKQLAFDRLLPCLGSGAGETDKKSKRPQKNLKENQITIDIETLFLILDKQFKAGKNITIYASCIASLGKAAQAGISFAGKLPSRNICQKFSAHSSELTPTIIAQLLTGLNQLLGTKRQQAEADIHADDLNNWLRVLTRKTKTTNDDLLSCLEGLYGLMKKSSTNSKKQSVIKPLTSLNIDLVNQVFSKFITSAKAFDSRTLSRSLSYVSLINTTHVNQPGKMEFDIILLSLKLGLKTHEEALSHDKKPYLKTLRSLSQALLAVGELMKAQKEKFYQQIKGSEYIELLNKSYDLLKKPLADDPKLVLDVETFKSLINALRARVLLGTAHQCDELYAAVVYNIEHTDTWRALSEKDKLNYAQRLSLYTDITGSPLPDVIETAIALNKPKEPAKKSQERDLKKALKQTAGYVSSEFESGVSYSQDLGSEFWFEGQRYAIGFEFNGPRYHQKTYKDYFSTKFKEWTGTADHVEPIDMAYQSKPKEVIARSLKAAQEKRAALLKKENEEWYECLAGDAKPTPRPAEKKSLATKTKLSEEPACEVVPDSVSAKETPSLPELIETPKIKEKKSAKLPKPSDKEVLNLAMRGEHDKLSERVNELGKHDHHLIISTLLEVMKAMRVSKSEEERLADSAKVLIKRAQISALVAQQNSPLREAVVHGQERIINFIKNRYTTAKKTKRSETSRRKRNNLPSWEQLLVAINTAIEDKPALHRELFINKLKAAGTDEASLKVQLKWFDLAVQGNAQAQCGVGKIFSSSKEGVPENYPEAAYWFKLAAEKGHAEAQFYLGAVYLKTPGSEDAAVIWFEKAANHMHEALLELHCFYRNRNNFKEAEYYAKRGIDKYKSSTSRYNLAVLYLEKAGDDETSHYLKEAINLFYDGAIDEHADCQYELALRYDNGHGCAQNTEKAVEWYKKAADNGHVEASAIVGECYYYGEEGLKRNLKEAERYVRFAAENGSLRGQNLLGLYYECELDDSETAKEKYKLAADAGYVHAQLNLAQLLCTEFGEYAAGIEWYKRAADQEDIRAYKALAQIYDQDKWVKADYKLAMDYYLKAAEKGDVLAQYNMGMIYEEGVRVKADTNEAIKWYKKAAEQGNADASYSLAEIYLKKGDEYAKKAVEYLQKAAGKNHAQAWYQLGVCYERGLGAELSLTKAKLAYESAHNAGYIRAAMSLQKLLKKMGKKASKLPQLETLTDKDPVSDKKTQSCKNYSLGYFSPATASGKLLSKTTTAKPQEDPEIPKLQIH